MASLTMHQDRLQRLHSSKRQAVSRTRLVLCNSAPASTSKPNGHQAPQGPGSAGASAKAQEVAAASTAQLLNRSSIRSNPNALLRFGFPKGSLQQSTHDLFGRAGFKVKISERGYFPEVDDKELEMVLFRSQEIPRYVSVGVLDAGICGYDWIVESGSDVHIVCELEYSKSTSNPARWVLAVPEESDITANNLHKLDGTIIASELVETTKEYFKRKGVSVDVEYSWGATEVKAALPGVGGIVDITETGSSLRANKLKIVDTVLSSTTRLVANHKAWQDPAKRRKIEDMALLLKAALEGRRKVGLKMNLDSAHMATITKLLPAEQSPTVSPLQQAGWVAVEVIVDEKLARDLIPQVKRLGGTGIFTYNVQTIVH